MEHILRCSSCGVFTMVESCACGGKAVCVRPSKYSPDDKYGAYRRKVKEVELKSKGWL